ncbi:MAG TPA: ATP-binding protein [Myxococcaceae bacterium]|nr:ATP-binding protein [Myxococcaceae bacterium]
MRSLRRTLLVALLAAVAAVTCIALLATYQVARREIDAVFDYHLRQTALTLSDRALARAEASGGRSDLVIQVWDARGVRLYVSRPDAQLPEVAELGFKTVHAPSGDFRVYSALLGDQVIQVAQPLAIRERLAFTAASRTLWPVLLLLPVLAVVVWRVVGRGLAPLDRLAHAAASRTPAALDPFPEGGVPEEVLPLVRALNELLGRLRAALAAQRAFVADAAHELRTPLAALKLQAQLAQQASDSSERAGALADLQAGLDRATHVVLQLLTLAGLEPGSAAPPPGARVRLADLVRQAIADHALLAEKRGVDLGATRVSDEAVVRGDAAALRTMLANLVDNAVRYTPAGGRVDVAAGIERGRPWLEVADNGPGIPPGERRRVFDRFYRLPGTGEPGSGLGLAIVNAIAERHGAAVTLGETDGGGLTVRVAFPAAAEAPAPPSPSDGTAAAHFDRAAAP